jgi:hypothetical protein
MKQKHNVLSSKLDGTTNQAKLQRLCGKAMSPRSKARQMKQAKIALFGSTNSNKFIT